MKAVEFVLKTGDIKVVEIPKPTLSQKPSATQPNLLVKVVAASLDGAFDKKFPKPEFAGIFVHSSAAPLYLGWQYSGVVEEIAGFDKNDSKSNDNVLEGITVGTAIYGFLEYTPTQRQGSFAEYVVVNSKQCCIKPDSISFELAAAAPCEAVTALQALRDCGTLIPGKSSVLIIGAAGVVGSFAVVIAKLLGAARVTALCSERDVAYVQETLKPDAIINRSQYPAGKDPIQAYGEKFDIIFDCPNAYSAYQSFNRLQSKGTYVVTGPSSGLVAALLYSGVTFWTGKKARLVAAVPKREDLITTRDWLVQDKLKLRLDTPYDVKDIAAAVARHQSKERQGRVVIKVQDGWGN